MRICHYSFICDGLDPLELFHFLLVALVNVQKFFCGDQALETDVSVFFFGEECGWGVVLCTHHFYRVVWLILLCFLLGRLWIGRKEVLLE